MTHREPLRWQPPRVRNFDEPLWGISMSGITDPRPESHPDCERLD